MTDQTNLPAKKPQWVATDLDNDEPFVGRIVQNAPSSDSGTATTPANAQQETPDEPLGRMGRSKLAVLTTVFLVAGVLGVPLIYYSPAFSKVEKVFWIILATLYSGVLLYILGIVIVWTANRIFV